MPSGPKRLLVFLLCVAVAWYAHRPLLGAGFLGSDLAVLEDIDRCFEDEGWEERLEQLRAVAGSSVIGMSSILGTGVDEVLRDAHRVVRGLDEA